MSWLSVILAVALLVVLGFVSAIEVWPSGGRPSRAPHAFWWIAALLLLTKVLTSTGVLEVLP